MVRLPVQAKLAVIGRQRSRLQLGVGTKWGNQDEHPIEYNMAPSQTVRYLPTAEWNFLFYFIG